MTENTNPEPLWFGMDVDAELARYAEEDRHREEPDASDADPRRFPRRRGLRAALSSLGRGAPPPRLA
ncbi:MAG: hypothetical protein JST59_29715 [Actinobacteria bacterium]|jgi:hypothetical protein|nr:hypothetical protein [Actinomycetota bacterium]